LPVYDAIHRTCPTSTLIQLKGLFTINVLILTFLSMIQKLSQCLLCCLISATILSGCATTSHAEPLEGYNRGMTQFHDTIDALYIKPIAFFYGKTPSFVQTGVRHFIGNIQTLNDMANHFLQLNMEATLHDFWRFAINTTVGIGGLFDPARRMGLPRQRTDFGMTLARYGYRKSSYFVLPLLGPSTVRDSLGTLVDNSLLSSSEFLLDEGKINNRRTWERRYLTLQIINVRTQLLPVDELKAQALDPYLFVKNAYMQRRQHMMQKMLSDPQNKNTKK
jgi:phospholipid-binding lipoprotein MlaA